MFHASEDEVHRQLDIAIQWGRYGELFDFDARIDSSHSNPHKTLPGRGPYHCCEFIRRRGPTR